MAANRDDILLQRLQSTIDSWNSEVTAAHEGLARQIGDARHQLVTLIDALNKRGKTTNGHNGESLRGHALRERDSALGEVMQRNRDLEDTVNQLQEERRTLHRQIEIALAEKTDLAGQLAAHQEQEAAAARLIERTEKELAALRRTVDATSSAGATTKDEIERLKHAVQAAKQERADLAVERDRLRDEVAARTHESEQAKLEVLSLTSALGRIEEEAASALRSVQEQQDQIESLTADRTRLAEQLTTLQTEIEAANARADRHEAAGREALRELEALRAARDEIANAEASLRRELQLARVATDSLRQTEHELRDELASLNHQYERQAAQLAETVQELEAHWDLAKKANHREEAHARELAAVRQELAQVREESAAGAKSSTGSWQMEARLTELTKENEDLRRLLERAETETRASGSAAERGNHDIEAVRQELLAFEQLLVEREEAVEAAAARMLKLEETALRVQAEVAALRSGQGATPETSDELERVRARVRQLETANAEQAARIVEQEVELGQRMDEIAALRDDVAAIGETAGTQIDEIRRPSFAFEAIDETGQKKSMGEILVDAGIITGNQLASALDEQRTAKKRRLGSILVEKGLIREEIIAQVVASQLQLPFVRLSDTKIQRGAVALLDGRLATHHMCFPIAATTAEVVVAMANPLDLIAIEDLEFATHLKVKPVVATLSDITSAIVEHYGVTIANALAEDTFDVLTPPRVPTQQRPL